MPLEWAAIRSTARWVLPVLVGPRMAVRGARAKSLMGTRSDLPRHRAMTSIGSGTLHRAGRCTQLARRPLWGYTERTRRVAAPAIEGGAEILNPRDACAGEGDALARSE